jgi:hypothetical protein
MPKHKIIRKFGFVEKEILYSLSWKKLTNGERVIYLHLKGEFNGTNADRLILPFTQMRGIVGNASFWRGITKLEEVGFIDVVHRGGKPCIKEGRLKSEKNVYKISGRWRINEKSIQEYKEENTDRVKRKLQNEYSRRMEDEAVPEDEVHVSK